MHGAVTEGFKQTDEQVKDFSSLGIILFLFLLHHSGCSLPALTSPTLNNEFCLYHWLTLRHKIWEYITRIFCTLLLFGICSKFRNQKSGTITLF